MNTYSSDTVTRWACLELIKGRELSHAIQIKETRGHRLAAIIYVLKKLNWPIQTRYGEHGIAYYRLGHEVDTEALKKPRSFYPPKKKGAATPSSKKSDSNNPNPEDSDK